MQKIFVSYRRADSADVTGRVCDYLRNHFGDEVLFKDVESIPYGQQFPAVIEEAIAQCDVLLAIIGARWISITAHDGKRRLDHPGDFVRHEIVSALEREKTVVPVLVHGAPMPTPAQLPADLQALPTTNAAFVRPDPDFAADMARLCRHLEDHAGFLTAVAKRRRYALARRHELDGDYEQARHDYLEYFKYDLPFIDPHLRFCDFLKAREGRADAREIYAHATAGCEAIASRLAAIGLLPAARREQAYAAISNEHPDLAPAWYLRSGLYSADRLGDRSLDEIRRERDLLTRFVELDEAGQLAGHFIDAELVTRWRNDALERLEATRHQAGVLEQPLSVVWTPANDGWHGTIQIFEPALEIFWRAPATTTFVATGNSRVRDYATGQVRPNTHVLLASDQPAGEGALQYTNLDGRLVGPFKVYFDPQANALSSGKEILELTRQGWVEFRDWDERLLLYFSHLLAYRGVLSRIEYGLDCDEPDRDFSFPAAEASGVASITPDMAISVEVPQRTRYVTVRVTFIDGSQSRKMRFSR